MSLSFVTGDLFNLFVSFEVLLAASYVLITLGGRRDQIRQGMTYVVINMVASVLFLTAIAFVYASLGTVNMADLAEKTGGLCRFGCAPRLALLFLVVFGIKAAVFPRVLVAARLLPDGARSPSSPCSRGCSPRSASTPWSAARPCCSPGPCPAGSCSASPGSR